MATENKKGWNRFGRETVREKTLLGSLGSLPGVASLFPTGLLHSLSKQVGWWGGGD